MIDWLLNDILWGLGRKRAYVLTFVSMGTWLGYCNASITLIFGGFRDHLKNGGATNCCAQQFIFKRVLHIIRIKIRHLKGENKWEISRRLDPNGPDIGVH